jgi:hypothetical protein
MADPAPAQYIKVVPANVKRLGGNVIAVYVMEYLINQCRDEDGKFAPTPLSLSRMSSDLGITTDRIGSATRTLEGHGLLSIFRPDSGFRGRSTRYMPMVSLTNLEEGADK